ncbi:hypothetical protein BH09PAT2_BH09PAT2_10320 [soil metagenome]
MVEITKKTVLIIEDERPLLEAVKMKLVTSGFDVVTARSAVEGLNFMKDGVAIDVVWLDHYLLGQETGLDFVEKMKNHDTWKQIPIYVVSNTASPDKVQTYLQLGVNQFYTKADSRLDQIIGDIKKTLIKN